MPENYAVPACRAVFFLVDDAAEGAGSAAALEGYFRPGAASRRQVRGIDWVREAMQSQHAFAEDFEHQAHGMLAFGDLNIPLISLVTTSIRRAPGWAFSTHSIGASLQTVLPDIQLVMPTF